VVEDSGRLRVVEVEQVGAFRILLGREREFRTLLRVEEDARDADRLTTAFELLKSVRWLFLWAGEGVM
jgi:hypothetical protein